MSVHEDHLREWSNADYCYPNPGSIRSMAKEILSLRAQLASRSAVEAALEEVAEVARCFPRRTRTGGGSCDSEAHIIMHGTVWGLDNALNHLEDARSARRAGADTAQPEGGDAPRRQSLQEQETRTRSSNEAGGAEKSVGVVGHSRPPVPGEAQQAAPPAGSREGDLDLSDDEHPVWRAILAWHEGMIGMVDDRGGARAGAVVDAVRAYAASMAKASRVATTTSANVTTGEYTSPRRAAPPACTDAHHAAAVFLCEEAIRCEHAGVDRFTDSSGDRLSRLTVLQNTENCYRAARAPAAATGAGASAAPEGREGEGLHEIGKVISLGFLRDGRLRVIEPFRVTIEPWGKRWLASIDIHAEWGAGDSVSEAIKDLQASIASLYFDLVGFERGTGLGPGLVYVLAQLREHVVERGVAALPRSSEGRG